MRTCFFFAAFASLMLVSCSSGNKAEESAESSSPVTLESLKAEVKAIEDSLTNGTLQMDQSSRTGVRYAEKCLEIAERFPKSKEAPVYMDRAHIIFSTCDMHRRSVETGEKLIRDYPFYANRQMIIESMATTYDVFIVPRDKQKVERYYRMMLSEYPDIPAEQKAEIENRLAHIDLTFEEFISAKTAKSPVN